MAILSFLKADSEEILYQVVKGVMRLATQLKVKGYKRVSGRHRDHNRSDGDNDNNDNDIYGSGSMYHFNSDTRSELHGCRTNGSKEGKGGKRRKVKKMEAKVRAKQGKKEL